MDLKNEWKGDSVATFTNELVGQNNGLAFEKYFFRTISSQFVSL